MKKFASFIVNNRLVMVIIFAILTVASLVGMMFVDVNYDDTAYLPQDSITRQGLDAMYGEFGEGGNATVMLSHTDIEKAVEFKRTIEAIDGVASVIWIDDIFLSDEIGIIKEAQKNKNGEKVVSDGKAVSYIMHLVSKIGTLRDDEKAAIGQVFNGGSAGAELVDVFNKISEGFDSEQDKAGFQSFLLSMGLAVGSSGGGGFDLSMLDSFGPSLEMFYYENDKFGNYALFQVSFEKSDYDEKTMNAIEKIKDVENAQVSIVGNSATTYNSMQLVSKETTISMIVAGVIVIIILLLTTTSYFEPILLLLTIGVAILLNMGSNVFIPWMLGTKGISYITQGVASVLQLALTMDYCISLLHRFKEEKKKGLRSNEAMTEALAASFKPISSASLTTVASFVALMFMSYRLGLDMGIILAKGTVLSIISVLFLMPALILYTEKLIEKTEHKTFNLSFKRFSKGLVKSRLYLPFIILALIIPCFFFQANNTFTYGPEASLGGEETELAGDKEEMEKVFGKQNQTILLLPIEYYENGKELEITLELMEIDGISQVQSMSILDYGGVSEMMPDKFKKQFMANGKNSQYTRVVMFLDAPEEGDVTTAIVDDIKAVVKDNVVEEYGEGYLLGISSSTLDIKELVNSDYNIITYVSIALVALILLATFKSIVIPIILVVVIQGSVYVNMAVPYLTGLITGEAQPMVFVGYMLVSSILLGATIDYAILLTDRYMDHRRTMNKYDAVRHALADSSRTLITSAGILVAAGAAIQAVSTLPATGVFGAAIMRGGILSFIFVLVLLPQLLIILDKVIMLTTWKGKERMVDNKTTTEAPEIEESSVVYKNTIKRRRRRTSEEREASIFDAILRSIDDPDFVPDEYDDTIEEEIVIEDSNNQEETVTVDGDEEKDIEWVEPDDEENN